MSKETGKEEIGMSDYTRLIEALTLNDKLQNETRSLKSQRDGLLVEVEHHSKKIERLQSELTKARELIGEWRAIFGEAMARRSALYVKTDAFMPAHQAIASTHNVDESCGQDAEAAKGGDHVCQSCGTKGWTANCNHCIPY